MSSRDLKGIMFCKRDLTLDIIKEAIDALMAQHPEVQMTHPKEQMIECLYDSESYIEEHGRMNSICYFKLNGIKFSFSNWENRIAWKYTWDCVRQVNVEIWTDTGAWQQFIDEPERARSIVGPICTIANALGAYLGFAGHELLFVHEKEIRDIEYLKEILCTPRAGYSTFYFDDELVNSIGRELLSEWEIFEQVGPNGYFASTRDPPFIADLIDRYRRPVVAAIFNRLHQEYD